MPRLQASDHIPNSQRLFLCAAASRREKPLDLARCLTSLCLPVMPVPLLSPVLAWVWSLFVRLLLAILRTGPIPKHCAFVMDGNRRFARLRGRPVFDGHLEGFDNLKRVRRKPSSSGGARCLPRKEKLMLTAPLLLLFLNPLPNFISSGPRALYAA